MWASALLPFAIHNPPAGCACIVQQRIAHFLHRLQLYRCEIAMRAYAADHGIPGEPLGDIRRASFDLVNILSGCLIRSQQGDRPPRTFFLKVGLAYFPDYGRTFGVALAKNC